MLGHDDHIDQIIQVHRDLVQLIGVATASEWLQLDLTMAQLKALFALADCQPATIGLLGRKLGVRLPSTSLVADRLVQLGLAERWEDPHDRRRTFMQLTPEGTALVERLRQGSRDRFRDWLSALSADELAALRVGLQALRSAVAASAPVADDRPSVPVTTD